MNSIYPLDGVISSDPLQGGFRYLEVVRDGVTRHPGSDFNTPGGAFTDLGAAVICPSPGVIAFRGFWDGATLNEGNHVWIAHDNGDYTHYDHLQTAPIGEGMRLERGSVFATCGSTGNSDYPHLHFEVWLGSVWGPPPSWTFWPKGYTLEWVRGHYTEPEGWLKGAKVRADLAAGANGEETAVTEEDQAILDLVHALGANAESISGWINLIGALQAQLAQLQQPTPVLEKVSRVTLEYPDGSHQTIDLPTATLETEPQG